jgi:hypothetical protein
MSIATSLSKIGEVLAIWLNPERREKARMKGAISAAENLIAIYEATYENGGGIYAAWPKNKLLDYKTHYKKQFEAWKNG